jgi:hypothetical protein
MRKEVFGAKTFDIPLEFPMGRAPTRLFAVQLKPKKERTATAESRLNLMISTSISLLVGTLFVVLGALNVWLIFHASTALTTSGMSQRLSQTHRLGGYVFIALFCLMSYFMALRTRSASDELSTPALIHVLVAMSLVPLLFVKVLIARYYKTYYSALTSLGVIIFCLAFLLVALETGPYLLRVLSSEERASVPLQSSPPQALDLHTAEALMQKRCSRCHTLDRVIGA